MCSVKSRPCTRSPLPANQSDIRVNSRQGHAIVARVAARCAERRPVLPRVAKRPGRLRFQRRLPENRPVKESHGGGKRKSAIEGRCSTAGFYNRASIEQS